MSAREKKRRRGSIHRTPTPVSFMTRFSIILFIMLSETMSIVSPELGINALTLSKIRVVDVVKNSIALLVIYIRCIDVGQAVVENLVNGNADLRS